MYSMEKRSKASSSGHQLWHAGQSIMSGSNMGGYSSNTFQYASQPQNKSETNLTVRIRGKNNQITTTKGNVYQSLDEQQALEKRKKEMRKANQRLKNLE